MPLLRLVLSTMLFLLGFAMLFCLHFGFFDPLVFTAMYDSVVAAFKKLLELEDFSLYHSVLFSIFGEVRFCLSKENLFAELSIIG